jgi:hypothetical protein
LLRAEYAGLQQNEINSPNTKASKNDDGGKYGLTLYGGGGAHEYESAQITDTRHNYSKFIPAIK